MIKAKKVRVVTNIYLEDDVIRLGEVLDIVSHQMWGWVVEYKGNEYFLNNTQAAEFIPIGGLSYDS